jgi:hypothetical protein
LGASLLGLSGFTKDEPSGPGMGVGLGIIGFSVGVLILGCSGIGIGFGCRSELAVLLLLWGVRFLGIK